MTTHRTDTVTGHLEKLEGGRIVFVGKDPAVPDTVFFAFKNDIGEDTKLKLSKDAAQALGRLLTTPFRGERCTFPSSVVWRVVREGRVEVSRG